MSDDVALDHRRFQDLVRDDAEHLLRTLSATAADRYWFVRCYQSREEFLSRFPTATARAEALTSARQHRTVFEEIGNELRRTLERVTRALEKPRESGGPNPC